MDWAFFDISWQVAVVLRVLVAFVLCQALIKWITDQGHRTSRFLLQFAVSFIVACMVAISAGSIRFDALFVVVVALACLNTFGTFLQWKAVAISQSRTALFTFWDDIIAIALAWMFLGEQKFITPQIGLGLLLSFLSLTLFIRYAMKKSRVTGVQSPIPLRFYLYVATYSVIWGVAYFSERVWSYNQFSLPTFALAWYTGALVSALILFLFYKDASKDQQGRGPIGARGVSASVALGVGIYASMYLTLLAFKAPQVVVQPIFFVSEMIFPALIGLYVFHERKQFDVPEWFYFGLGAIGALTIGLSF